MSGTSLDGVDAVLVRLQRRDDGFSIRRLAFSHTSYPRGLKAMLLKNSARDSSNVEDIARLNFLLGGISADAVRKVARKGGIAATKIQLIGSHGQTIAHLPRPMRLFRKKISATLQIGDPSVIAAQTGVPTIGDFRVADVAVGGQGAPLVPYFDWLVFRSKSRNRVLLNIGGIANLTLLPAGCSLNDVRAFDTGPGNMVVDALMQRFYGRQFDVNGRSAAGGRVAKDLLAKAMRNEYFRRPLPKSAGREEFGDRFVAGFLKSTAKMKKRDIIATASVVTPLAIHEACMRYGRWKGGIDDLIISGGGARNKFFMTTLRELFGGAAVKTTDEFGIPVQEKEAICFAVLAYETFMGRAANLPSVTGARRRVVLGKICQP
jgi:anhydro-N-acetylmuramic acid kinase